jgi:hypothetical protein
MVSRIEHRFAIDWQVARRPAEAAVRRVPRLPVLVVHDEEDEETPYEGGERVAATFEQGMLMRTRGLGHRRLLRDPIVAARVAEFAAG